MRLHADRVDAGVGAASSRHRLESLDQVRSFFVVDDLGISTSSELQSFGEAIDRNHSPGAQHERRSDRELADRTTSPHSDYLSRLDVACLCRLISGWEDVRQKQHFLIRYIVGNLDWSDIRHRNADILCLSAGISAIHVRVAKQSGGVVAVQCFQYVSIW